MRSIVAILLMLPVFVLVFDVFVGHFLFITPLKAAEVVKAAEETSGFFPKEIWPLISIIFSAGSVGGFVDGLIVYENRIRHKYEVRLFYWSCSLGSIGDLLLGGITSVALFSVSKALLPFELDNIKGAADTIQLIAWCVLAGYAGVKILNPLAQGAEDIAKRLTELARKSHHLAC